MKIIALNARKMFTAFVDVVRCLQEHRNRDGKKDDHANKNHRR